MNLWQRLAGIPSGRVTKWFVVALWLVAAGALGPVSGKLADAQNNDATAWLPRTAESTKIFDELPDFRTGDVTPAIIIYVRDGGITDSDEAKVDRDRQALTGAVHSAPIDEATRSSDDAALYLSVPLIDGDDSGDAMMDDLKKIREVVGADPPDGLAVKVTGPAGSLYDFVDAFSGLDSTLLLVSAAVVALILLVTYRSPVLWLLPLMSVGVAIVSAQAVIYLLAEHAGLVVNGQSAGILTVLVFGAGTDYALLLIARYREELHQHEDRHVAMAVAMRRSVPAILASCATVVISLLCLLAAELNSNRGLGPVGAIGVACAFLTMTIMLPALLVLLGRWVFWPFIPRVGGMLQESTTVWARIGRAVGRRPRMVWVSCVVLLGALAFGSLGATTGLSSEGQFRTAPESVEGQRLLADHFSAGTAAPADVIADADAEQQVLAAIDDTRGVDGPGQIERAGDRIHVPVVLSDPPDSKAAEQTVERLRTALHAVPGANAITGGATATTVDTNNALSHDKKLIIPLVLLVVFVVLSLLLRALVAPLLLIGTVVLSFLASYGASSLLFQHVFGFEGIDTTLLLSSFIFLVALGIDYNIFLMTRVREEAVHIGHRRGVLRGLGVTGGVITSAGVVLAATFSVLAVLPLVSFVEIGVLVAFGVLLDTFLVRSVLVPALALDLGRPMWWPSRLARGSDGDLTGSDGAGASAGAAGSASGAGDGRAADHADGADGADGAEQISTARSR